MTKSKDLVFLFWHQNRMILTALITIVILFYPIGFVHEGGHFLIGYISNSNCVLKIDWALKVDCETTPQPVLLYFSLGGIFGMIAGSLLFVSKKVRTNKGIFIGVSVIVFDHILKAVFETQYHFAYVTNFAFGMLLATLPILLMFGLLMFFTKRSKSKP